LQTLHYNDSAMIVRLLTEQAGAVSMLVPIRRGRRTAVRHTLFQPLAVLSVEWNEQPRRELQHPREVLTALPLASLPYDARKAAIALFVAESLYYAVRTERDTRDIFAYVVRSIEWLDTCEGNFANFHLVFLLHLTAFLGFKPNIEDARAGDWFDLRAACFVHERPMHSDYLSPAEAALLPKLLRMNYGTMRLFRFTGAERSQLLGRINDYYRLHLPSFPQLKSLEVLRQLF